MAKTQDQRSIAEIIWEIAKEPFQAKKKEPFQAKKKPEPTQPGGTSADPCFSVEICGEKLRASYKKTAIVPTSVWSKLSRVDIDREATLAGSEQSELGHYSDLFTPIGKGNQPKRILVQGEIGIGKSTFVKKLAVDWARLGEAPTFLSPVSPGPPDSGCFPDPGCCQFLSRRFRRLRETLGFDDKKNSSTEDKETAVLKKSNTQATVEQAAVLRKFKLVVFVDLKEVSKGQRLKDVIYNSRLFAREDKWLVDGLLRYITDHQDEVLLLLDGYDENHSGQESQIFDIFSGNELRDCCVLITSRISKAGELQEFQDLLAEITGFSKEDKLTYLTRQLGDERDARDLYDHLEEKDLLDLAKVPLLLLFFCTLWKMGQLEGLSKAKTSLYLKIVQQVLSHNQGKNTPLRTFRCFGLSAMKDLGTVIKNCTHLMSIDVQDTEDSVCEFLQQLPNRSKCGLKLNCKLMSKGTEELAELLPSFENITELCICFVGFCAEEAIMRLVSSITHKSVVNLELREIHLTPAVAAAIGLSLPRLSSLQHFRLVGTGDTSLNVEDMLALFGKIDKDMPLKSLTFRNVSVSGSLTPLTGKLLFFPHLTRLDLECLDLDESDLQDLETSFSDIPNLESLSLRGNALDHLQKPLASFLMKLGKIESFFCVGCKLSLETLRILKEARPHLFIRPSPDLFPTLERLGSAPRTGGSVG